MEKRIHITHSKPDFHSMLLDVTVNKRTIEVSPGDVTLFGETQRFPGESFTCPIHVEHEVGYRGNIVKDVATGKFELFIDEVVRDGIDSPYVFEPGGPYTDLATLFIVVFDKGSKTKLLQFDTWKIVEAEG